MIHTKDKASYFEWTICLDNPTSSLRKYGHKRCKGKGVKVVIWTQNVSFYFFFSSYTSVADTSWIVYAGWVNGQLTMCTSLYSSWYLIHFLFTCFSISQSEYLLSHSAALQSRTFLSWVRSNNLLRLLTTFLCARQMYTRC